MQQHAHNLSHKKGLRQFLRTHGTIAEAVMWRMLKSRQIEGAKFRRQFSIENYILDFYCPELRLCIELDGAPHFTEERILQDKCRTKNLLDMHKIQTIRFENKMVLDAPEWVRNKVVEAVIQCKLGIPIDNSSVF